MSDFSSILSSIGRKPQAPQQSSDRQPSSPARGPHITPNIASNAKPAVARPPTAGLKRNPEELESDSNTKFKVAKLNDSRQQKDATAPATSSRFQLSTKAAGSQQQPPRDSQRSTSNTSLRSDPKRPVPQSVPRPNEAAPKSNTSISAPVKRSFASIMEKAKAAEKAAKAAGASTIQHRTRERLTKRDRLRLMEEAKAEQKARRKGGGVSNERHGTANGPPSGGAERTMSNAIPTRKPPQPLSYKGTMRKEDAQSAFNRKRKGESHGKYGGYASWSDMDEAEDEEEDDDEEDYGSDASSDMEGGFNDLEREELISARTARKEDQEHLEEEERLRREKLARKRKLMELAQNAKAKKKF